MADLYIFGTTHTLQCAHASCPPSSVAAFDMEVRRLCVQHNVLRIAEEMSSDGLAFHNVETTIGERVAADLKPKLDYQHVDLTNIERAALSIDDSPFFTMLMNRDFDDEGANFRAALKVLASGVRERCWVSRLLTKTTWPTLFICGADHVQSVHKLWCSLGLEARIVHRSYAP